MKIPTALVLAIGLLVGQRLHAEEPIGHPRWVIFATIIDRNTGARIKQSKLDGPELEFYDRGSCTRVVGMVQPARSGNLTAVLTCRRVERADSPPERSQNFEQHPRQRLRGVET